MLIGVAVTGGTAVGETRCSIVPEIGFISGSTSYKIGGVEYDPTYGYYSWASKLEWPIDSALAGVHLTVNTDRGFAFEMGIRKNLTYDTGKMRDSDYVDGYRFIYSESDTEMDMTDFDIKGRFNPRRVDKNNIGLIIGYRHQELSFNAKNLAQRSTIPELNGDVKGLAGTYEVIYSIPYAGISLNSSIAKGTEVTLAAEIGYLEAMNQDDHVLRYKKATGKGTGSSINLSGNLSYNVTESFFVRMIAEYLLIDAHGKQTQRWYATTSEATAGTIKSGIDMEIESEQAIVSLGAEYLF